MAIIGVQYVAVLLECPLSKALPLNRILSPHENTHSISLSQLQASGYNAVCSGTISQSKLICQIVDYV